MFSVTKIEPYKPCFVAWCPVDSELLAVGTYALDESDASGRLGSIELYKFAEHDNKLHHWKTVPTDAGVFRLKWLSYNGADCFLVAALTNGAVFTWSLQTESAFSAQLCPDAMLLCFAVSDDQLVASDSLGRIHLCKININNGILSPELQRSWSAHQLPYTGEPTEVWMVDWISETSLISGADDCLMKLWDVRSPLDKPYTVNKCHQGGVASFLKLHNTSEFLTGSYDETIRRFDCRNFASKTTPVSSVKLDGGIWTMDYNSGVILVASMYGGWAAVDETDLRIMLRNCQPRKDLLYGASFRKIPSMPPSAAFCTFNNSEVFMEKIDHLAC